MDGELVVGAVWEVRRVYVMQRASTMRQLQLLDGDINAARNRDELRLLLDQRDAANLAFRFIENAITACDVERKRLIEAYIN